MSKNWYIISTYAGYEDKIEKLLNMKIESGEISSDIVTSVKVPKEEVVDVCDKSLQSCPTLYDPMGCSPPGSFVHGFLQARTLEWVAFPFSRGSS